MKTFLLATAMALLVATPEANATTPGVATSSRPGNRSLAECLDYSVKVLRVLDVENIKKTNYGFYGWSSNSQFVIRCEVGATGAHTVSFLLR
jgi:hypothetical protein